MIGPKLAWTGLAMILITPIFGFKGVTAIAIAIAGAVIMSIGVVLIWLDK